MDFELAALANRPATEELPILEQDISLTGSFDPRQMSIALNDLRIVSGDEEVAGSFNIGLESTTSPSVKGSLQSAQLSPPNLLNAWPFHIAPKVQDWIAENISGGKARDFTLNIDVAQGRLAETQGR